MMSQFANTPTPPYYAVIFTSLKKDDTNGYAQMAGHMSALVATQPGFLGAESVRDEAGFGVTISYWESLEAIRNWKRNEEHQVAQDKGKKEWYQQYVTRVCKVERAYSLHDLE